MIFEDRRDAGEKLLAEIQKQNLSPDLVLALPRGGVEVAVVVAKGLNVPMDLILVRKLGAPFNSELAIGAIVEGDPIHEFLNQDMIKVLKVEPTHIEKEKKIQKQEIERQQKAYRGGQARRSVQGKKVLVIDDGVATGASVIAALQGLKNEKPRELILGIPVSAPDTAEVLEKMVDKMVCLSRPEVFTAVGKHFKNFHQVTDEDVKKALH